MSKFDQNRIKDGWEKLHKPTDTTKIMATWPWTNINKWLKITTRRRKIWTRNWKKNSLPRRRRVVEKISKSVEKVRCDWRPTLVTIGHIYVRNFVVLRVATRPKNGTTQWSVTPVQFFSYLLYFLSVCSWIYMSVGGSLQRVLVRHVATPLSLPLVRHQLRQASQHPWL